jgi:Cdc6-like AAA superfamily ATPase
MKLNMEQIKTDFQEHTNHVNKYLEERKIQSENTFGLAKLLRKALRNRKSGNTKEDLKNLLRQVSLGNLFIETKISKLKELQLNKEDSMEIVQFLEKVVEKNDGDDKTFLIGFSRIHPQTLKYYDGKEYDIMKKFFNAIIIAENKDDCIKAINSLIEAGGISNFRSGLLSTILNAFFPKDFPIVNSLSIGTLEDYGLELTSDVENYLQYIPYFEAIKKEFQFEDYSQVDGLLLALHEVDEDEEDNTDSDEEEEVGFDSGNEELPQYPKNLIYYGPPGTGKTYKAIQTAYEILFGEEADSTIHFKEIKARLARERQQGVDLQALSWIDAILLAFAELGSRLVTHANIRGTRIMGDYAASRTSNQNIEATIRQTLQTYAKVNSHTVRYSRKNGEEFFDKDSRGRWFLLRNGKEELDRLREATALRQGGSNRFEFVSFHQSYSYEDFIEGIRPRLEQEELSYYLHKGIFQRLCNRARADPERNYVLLVDEINRGNISKILGELITLVEENKRDDRPEGISLCLPYSAKPDFSIPSNVYVIGTMNSTDKSIALVDIALRRRFKFEKLSVDLAQVKNQKARDLLKDLNQKVCALKDSDHEIGHSYFMRIPQDDDGSQLKVVFEDQILPLIEEYFYNNWDALATILGPDAIEIVRAEKQNFDEGQGRFVSGDSVYGFRLKDFGTVYESTLRNLIPR